MKVVAIDFDRLVVILEDAIVPILEFQDEEGDECEQSQATQLLYGDRAHGYSIIHANELKPRVLH